MLLQIKAIRKESTRKGQGGLSFMAEAMKQYKTYMFWYVYHTMPAPLLAALPTLHMETELLSSNYSDIWDASIVP